MNYDRNFEIISKHTFMITNKICILLHFQSFLCTKHFFLTKVIFSKDIPQCFNFQGLFKARANHANGNCKLRAEFASPMAKSTSPGYRTGPSLHTALTGIIMSGWLSEILNSFAVVSIIFEVSSGFRVD